MPSKRACPGSGLATRVVGASLVGTFGHGGASTAVPQGTPTVACEFTRTGGLCVAAGTTRRSIVELVAACRCWCCTHDAPAATVDPATTVPRTTLVVRARNSPDTTGVLTVAASRTAAPALALIATCPPAAP